MRVFISFICLSIFTLEVIAQCPDNVNLTNQVQVDSFEVDNPDCTDIPGNLTIWWGVSDLSGMAQIRSVGGDVSVNAGDFLTSFHGLHNISAIEGDLKFHSYPAMANPSGLEGLTTVGGDLDISPGPGFTSLNGLNNLISIGSLKIGASFFGGDPSSLKDLSGLESLITITEALVIDRDSSLSSLKGLNNLTTVGQGFRIANSPTLKSLEGLNSLKEVGGRVEITACDSLKNTKDLSSLQHVEFDMFISNCPQLQDLGTFGNLSTVGVQPFNSISISHLPSLDKISGFGALTNTGSVIIDDCTSLNRIAGFTALTRIPGSLNIRQNPNLDMITGFGNLTELEDGLRLYDNGELNDLSGFNAIVSVGDFFELSGNGMTEISDFNSLHSIENRFEIVSNLSLETITGFQELRIVGSSVNVSGNDVLLDCSTLCELVSNAPSNVNILIFNINGNCQYINQELQSCEEKFIDKIWDANPAIIEIAYPGILNAEELTPNQIALLDTSREMIAADGITEVILQLRFDQETSFLIAEEGFSQPWGTTTTLINGNYLGFVKYTAPEIFDQQGAMIENEILNRDVPFEMSIDEGQTVADHISIVPPPVVLVHGTFSSPTTWTSHIDGQQSMKEAIESAGYYASTVNYENTNGSGDPSSFSQNSKMVWENGGGIRDALSYYRHRLDIAVSQADVIGHSMGGVLPRVYVSDHYNPSGYRRNDNFMDGDINRLITIGSTHHGSHLGEFQQFLSSGSPLEFGIPGWFASEAATFLGNWVGGSPPSEAVKNQSPESEALELINRTDVPAHAITIRAPLGKLKDATYDPSESYFDLYKYLSLLLYYNSGIRDAYLDKTLELCNRGLKAETTKKGDLGTEIYPGLTDEQIFKQMLIDGLGRNADELEAVDGEFETPDNIEIFHPDFGETEMNTFNDPLIEGFRPNEEPNGIASNLYIDLVMPTVEQLEPKATPVEALRSLIFNHDDNDGVVRIESQSGELEKECADCVSFLDNVLHGPAPQYPEVQQKVVELLDGGMDHFSPDGFPPAGNPQKLYYPPFRTPFYIQPKSGTKAVCASGMVPSHASQYAIVADENDVIIMVRPVNVAATPLISGGAATKEMDVKPKSSNWGPQKGYLPRKQRYSKIWNVFTGSERMNKIEDYDIKSEENITSGLTKARQLSVTACGRDFMVFIDNNKYTGPNDMNAIDEVVLVPKDDGSMVCSWGDEFDASQPVRDCKVITNEQLLIPFEVMATPRVAEKDGTTPRFLTADYDLLMIGFYEGEDLQYSTPPEVLLQPGVGAITPRQDSLVRLLNEAVKNRTGYSGGALTHHGPENQFSKSPYVDYPITVFMPDNRENGFFNGPKGKILSIDMGPPGFRDIHLKRFINRMRKKGYDLYENPTAPGWHWTWNKGIGGFELADSPLIGDYVEQLPKNSCDKSGLPISAQCVSQSVAANQELGFTDFLFGRSIQPSFQVNLLNNKVNNDWIQMDFSSDQKRDVGMTIFDDLGVIYTNKTISIPAGEFSSMIDISNLSQGIHFIKVNGVKPFPFLKVY